MSLNSSGGGLGVLDGEPGLCKESQSPTQREVMVRALYRGA